MRVRSHATRPVLVAALLGALCLGFVSGSRDASAAQETTCFDSAGTFDPLAFGGGCYAYDRDADSVVVAGRALISGSYLEYGRSVEARVGAVRCGSTMTSGGGGDFTLTINGAELQDGCATPGQTVDFYVYGTLAAQTLVWPTPPHNGPIFLSLVADPDHAWYWFERVSTPRPAVGAIVQAYVGTTLCGKTTIGGEDNVGGLFVPEGIRGFYRLVVPQTEFRPDCAPRNGELTEFKVNGLRAETAVQWRPGVQRLNLMVQGDANCDFLIDARDALLALQVAAALITGVPCHGDADRDRDIDVFDARDILEFAAHITGALPL